MKRLTVSILFALTLLAVLAQPAQARGPRPPPGFGKPSPLPPANGTGTMSFEHGGPALTLPLNKVEITKTSSGAFMYSLVFVDADQKNRASLAFILLEAKPQKVADSLITGVLFRTKAGGTSKGNANKTVCNLVLTTADDKSVAGTASCDPMFALDGTTPAKPARGIRFEAKVK